MEPMSEQFSRPGAVDLSSLAASAAASPSAGGAPGGNWVMDAGEPELDRVIQLSARHPVILELWSPRAQGGEQLSTDLAQLTNEAGGAWLLARVNVDVEPMVAQALQVQAVPTVVALIGGQVAPLFQGTRSRAEIADALSQVTQVAVANGMVGRAEPVPASPTTSGAAVAGDEQPPQADPRFAAADAALEAGDYATAVAEFDTLLAATPADPEVQAGRAQSALLLRSTQWDPATVVTKADAAPDDVDAQLDAADLEIIGQRVDEAFTRILDVIRRTSGDDRDKARVRLLELFTIIGATDPRVLNARRALSTALF